MNEATISETRRDTRELVTAALLAALLAAAALISIPIGAVPLTLQVFVVVLAALLLRPAAAGTAVGVYLLLGGIGVPVFAGMQGGLGVMFGPTGGYLVGFFVGAVAGSFVRTRLTRVKPLVADIAAAATCIVVIYAFGWFQLHSVTGLGFREAFIAGVVPFVLIDVAKAAVAVGVAGALRRAGVVPAAR